MKKPLILAALALSCPVLASAHAGGATASQAAGFQTTLATQSASISGGQSAASTTGGKGGSSFTAENMGTTSSVAKANVIVNPITGAMSTVNKTTTSNDNASMVSGIGAGHASASGNSASQNLATSNGAALGWSQFKLGNK